MKGSEGMTEQAVERNTNVAIETKSVLERVSVKQELRLLWTWG